MLKPELLQRLKQPVDMGWLSHPHVWYVGDFDTVVRIGDEIVIYIEIKKAGKPGNKWQDKAYHQEVDAMTNFGKRAFYLRCIHQVEDADEPIKLLDCTVVYQYDHEGVRFAGMRVEEVINEIVRICEIEKEN